MVWNKDENNSLHLGLHWDSCCNHVFWCPETNVVKLFFAKLQIGKKLVCLQRAGAGTIKLFMAVIYRFS
jgi:hypothetical protein